MDTRQFTEFVTHCPQFRCLFVNDGSTDGTLNLLHDLSKHPSGRITYLDLEKNTGKAEAVRRGLQYALKHSNSKYLGYLDGDLSTSWRELAAFVQILDDRSEIVMVLGSRVKLLGRSIERRALRHYLGRVFATMASLVLNIAVYDTQCGAKLMRATANLEGVLATPFSSRWIFDVEILARLARELGLKGQMYADLLVELPLQEWKEVEGSKVRPRDFIAATLEIAKIYLKYRPYLR